MKIGAQATLDDRTARAVYAASCAGLLVFSAVFVGTATSEGISLAWYDAEGHAWHLASTKPTPAAMDWYGRLLYSTIGAVVASAITFFAGRTRTIPATALRAASIWALAMTVLGCFLYAWTLANRVILPPGS